MSHLEAVRALLLADASVAALVGTRVYPLSAPQGAARPFLVVTSVSDVPATTMNGLPADLLRNARVQVDSYAETYLEAHALFEAVNNEVAALSGPTISAVLLSASDMRDDETGLYRKSADFSVWR